MKKVDTIEIPNPANHHVHLREERMLEFTSFFSRLFSVVVAKANLKNPVVDAAGYDKYYNQDLLAYSMPQVIGGIMMTPGTTAGTVEEAYRAGARFVANIPEGVSTNSNGILLMDLTSTRSAAVYASMSELGMPLLLHVQSKFNTNLSKWELECFFSSIKLIKCHFPKLKISIEHPNLKSLIEFIYATSGMTGGIAPHYGLYTEYNIFGKNGEILRPEIFCQPPYANIEDRLAVKYAMADPYHHGERKFRYAADDAPHSILVKKGNVPASGVFSGPVGPCVVAEILESIGRLEDMPEFMKYDEEFFGVPLNSSSAKTMVLEKREWAPPRIAQCGETPSEQVYLLKGGEKVSWQIV
ncbi:hypothetical protein KKH14_01610 [Patescibacteria group bacterium]|nr:hypothetical protein [Patescibacteria group bacterium]